MLIRSVRTAIMLLSLLFILIVALTVFFLALNEHRTLYARYVESDLNALTENMASDLVGILSQPDYFFELKTYLLGLDAYQHIKSAVVYDKTWEPLDVFVGPDYVEQEVSSHGEMHLWREQPPGLYREQGVLVAVKRIGDPALVLGYLVVIDDLSGPLSTSTRNLAIHTLPASAIAALLLMALFYMQGNRWLRPLIRLSEFVRRVEDTKDYKLKIPVTGQYEIASLTENVNSMIEAIRVESEMNQEYVDLLEERREEMEYLANYDGLTGLVNRQYFMNLLEDLLTENPERTGIAMMFIDLDGFKVVNDSLGHNVGDLLLVEVAERLKSYVPADDVVSRHGGDEFLVLMRHCASDDALRAIADRIVQGLMQKYLIQTWEVRISASVGIAVARPETRDALELIRNADVAMYHSKSLGKSRYSFFNPGMMRDYQRRIDIANALESALADDEFTVHYQAKAMSSGRVVGAEALVRWTSKTLGFVSPGEFIPIAEQSGKVTDITQWVIDRVCRDIRDHFSLLTPRVPVSINLSAFDLKKYHMVGFIKGAFLKYEVPAGMVEFEVTEYSYLDNLEMANRFFGEISAMGCPVALDDFGTGYSSLSYLTQIPIDVIKIDKQFIDNIGHSRRDDALVLTIIEMAKRLGMGLCAEGVETEEQAEFLDKHGCGVMQGYLYSKPIPIAPFMDYLNQKQSVRAAVLPDGDSGQ
ncbi:putative bifunctional diguanylate cyclase/phosphodiesterase [Thalassolituus sp. LLYu03]|uniref:putative bifunctional diguanylate cyclase/phosphodiesterase n=1 Tax=Thalassolituus sp. LLYu03 TaxID=3421656 RepID=UPI003D293C89